MYRIPGSVSSSSYISVPKYVSVSAASTAAAEIASSHAHNSLELHKLLRQTHGLRRFPKGVTDNSGLRLTGRFVYIQLRPLSSKAMTLHVDVQTQGKHMYRFSLSSMYKSVRMRLGKVAEIPLCLPRRWTMLALDTHRLLELVTQGHALGHQLQFVRAVKLCCSMAVRGVWTSDTEYTPGNLHKDLALHLPKGNSFGDMYAFLWVPAPPPTAQHKFASALSAQMALDSQALSAELHSTAHDSSLGVPLTPDEAAVSEPAPGIAPQLQSPASLGSRSVSSSAADALPRRVGYARSPLISSEGPSAGMATSASSGQGRPQAQGVSWQAQDSKGAAVQPPPLPDTMDALEGSAHAGIATRADVLDAADDIMAGVGLQPPPRALRNAHGPKVPSTNQVPTSMGIFGVPPSPEELNVSGSVVEVGAMLQDGGGRVALLGPDPSPGAQVAEALKGPTRGPTVSTSDPVMSLAGVMGVASGRQGALQWAPSGDEVVFPVGRVITALRVTADDHAEPAEQQAPPKPRYVLAGSAAGGGASAAADVGVVGLHTSEQSSGSSHSAGHSAAHDSMMSESGVGAGHRATPIRQQRHFVGHSRDVVAVALMQDSSVMASAQAGKDNGTGPELRLWDFATGAGIGVLGNFVEDTAPGSAARRKNKSKLGSRTLPGARSHKPSTKTSSMLEGSIAFSDDDCLMCAVAVDSMSRYVLLVWDVSPVKRFMQQRTAWRLSLPPTEAAARCSAAVLPTLPLVARQLSDFPVARVRFSPFDVARLVTTGKENVRLWRMKKGHMPACPVTLGKYARGTEFVDVAFDAPFATGLGGAAGGAATSSRAHPASLGTSRRTDVVPTAHQRRMYVASSAGSVLQINYDTHALEAVFQLHSGPIHSIAVNEGFCVTGAADGFMRMWPLDFSDFFLEARHDSAVTSVALHPSGLSVVTCTGDGSIGRLDVASHTHKVLMRSHTAPVLDVATRPLPIAVAPPNGMLSVPEDVFRTNAAAACVSLSPGGEVASASLDGTIRVWDMATWSQTAEFRIRASDDVATTLVYQPVFLQCSDQGHAEPNQAEAEQPHVLVVGFASGCVRVFDVDTTRCIVEYAQHTAPVGAMEFLGDPACPLLFTAARDGSVCVYDVQHQYTPVKMLTSHVSSASQSASAAAGGWALSVALAASPCCRYVAVAFAPSARDASSQSQPGSMFILDPYSLTLIDQLAVPLPRLPAAEAAAAAAEQSSLAARLSAGRSTARNHSDAGPLVPHGLPVAGSKAPPLGPLGLSHLCFSGDGNALTATSLDGRVLKWHVPTRKLQRQIRGAHAVQHADMLLAAAAAVPASLKSAVAALGAASRLGASALQVTADDSAVITGGSDGAMCVFDASFAGPPRVVPLGARLASSLGGVACLDLSADGRGVVMATTPHHADSDSMGTGCGALYVWRYNAPAAVRARVHMPQSATSAAAATPAQASPDAALDSSAPTTHSTGMGADVMPSQPPLGCAVGHSDLSQASFPSSPGGTGQTAAGLTHSPATSDLHSAHMQAARRAASMGSQSFDGDGQVIKGSFSLEPSSPKLGLNHATRGRLVPPLPGLEAAAQASMDGEHPPLHTPTLHAVQHVDGIDLAGLQVQGHAVPRHPDFAARGSAASATSASTDGHDGADMSVASSAAQFELFARVAPEDLALAQHAAGYVGVSGGGWSEADGHSIRDDESFHGHHEGTWGMDGQEGPQASEADVSAITGLSEITTKVTPLKPGQHDSPTDDSGSDAWAHTGADDGSDVDDVTTDEEAEEASPHAKVAPVGGGRLASQVAHTDREAQRSPAHTIGQLHEMRLLGVDSGVPSALLWQAADGILAYPAAGRVVIEDLSSAAQTVLEMDGGDEDGEGGLNLSRVSRHGPAPQPSPDKATGPGMFQMATAENVQPVLAAAPAAPRPIVALSGTPDGSVLAVAIGGQALSEVLLWRKTYNDSPAAPGSKSAHGHFWKCVGSLVMEPEQGDAFSIVAMSVDPSGGAVSALAVSSAPGEESASQSAITAAVWDIRAFSDQFLDLSRGSEGPLGDNEVLEVEPLVQRTVALPGAFHGAPPADPDTPQAPALHTIVWVSLHAFVGGGRAGLFEFDVQAAMAGNTAHAKAAIFCPPAHPSTMVVLPVLNDDRLTSLQQAEDSSAAPSPAWAATSPWFTAVDCAVVELPTALHSNGTAPPSSEPYHLLAAGDGEGRVWLMARLMQAGGAAAAAGDASTWGVLTVASCASAIPKGTAPMAVVADVLALQRAYQGVLRGGAHCKALTRRGVTALQVGEAGRVLLGHANGVACAWGTALESLGKQHTPSATQDRGAARRARITRRGSKLSARSAGGSSVAASSVSGKASARPRTRTSRSTHSGPRRRSKAASAAGTSDASASSKPKRKVKEANRGKTMSKGKPSVSTRTRSGTSSSKGGSSAAQSAIRSASSLTVSPRPAASGRPPMPPGTARSGTRVSTNALPTASCAWQLVMRPLHVAQRGTLLRPLGDLTIPARKARKRLAPCDMLVLHGPVTCIAARYGAADAVLLSADGAITWARFQGALSETSPGESHASGKKASAAIAAPVASALLLTAHTSPVALLGAACGAGGHMPLLASACGDSVAVHLTNTWEVAATIKAYDFGVPVSAGSTLAPKDTVAMIEDADGRPRAVQLLTPSALALWADGSAQQGMLPVRVAVGYSNGQVTVTRLSVTVAAPGAGDGAASTALRRARAAVLGVASDSTGHELQMDVPSTDISAQRPLVPPVSPQGGRKPRSGGTTASAALGSAVGQGIHKEVHLAVHGGAQVTSACWAQVVDIHGGHVPVLITGDARGRVHLAAMTGAAGGHTAAWLFSLDTCTSPSHGATPIASIQSAADARSTILLTSANGAVSVWCLALKQGALAAEMIATSALRYARDGATQLQLSSGDAPAVGAVFRAGSAGTEAVLLSTHNSAASSQPEQHLVLWSIGQGSMMGMTAPLRGLIGGTVDSLCALPLTDVDVEPQVLLAVPHAHALATVSVHRERLGTVLRVSAAHAASISAVAAVSTQHWEMADGGTVSRGSEASGVDAVLRNSQRYGSASHTVVFSGAGACLEAWEGW